MLIYNLTLFSVYFLGLFKSNRSKKNSNYIAIIAICAILILVSGFRQGVGTDFYTYKGLFEYYMNLPILETLQVEEGLFWSIASIIGVFTNNVTYVYIVCAAISVFAVVITLKKYSVDFALSIFLYLTGMSYFSGFNGIRQIMAASLTFAAFPLLLEKKYIKYLIVSLIIYNIHNSAVILLPFVILVTMKTDSIKFNCLLLFLFIVLFLFPSISNTLFSLFVPDNYQHYLILDATDDGVNIFRVLVALVPVVISKVYYRSLRCFENQKKIDILINFSILNLFILILATRSTVLARIGMYTDLYALLLYPYFIKLFKTESKNLARVIIMVCFYIYMMMLLPMDSNLLPYRSIFGGVFY